MSDEDIRFDIVENCCSGGAILKDLTGELQDIPLGFSIMEMDTDEREWLMEWLDYLNSKE